MVPHLVIGIAALVGLFGWGFKGLIVGAAGAFVLAMVLGLVFTVFSGGLLPRKVRKNTASSFIALHDKLVSAAFPNTSQAEHQRSIERCLEKIFKRAATDNKSMNLEAGMDRSAIQAAAAALVAEEQRSEMKALFASLEQHIEREMYQ